MAEGVASVHIEIPITYWVTETSRTWPDYLAWDRLTDTKEEARMLRRQADKQQYLKDLLTPPGHGAGFPSDTAWLSDAQDYVVLTVDSVLGPSASASSWRRRTRV